MAEATLGALWREFLQTKSPLLFIKGCFYIRWVRFGLVGVAATLTYYLLGILFVNILRLPIIAGNTAAFVISFGVSYLGQKAFTFQSRGNAIDQLWKFAAAQGIGLGLNTGIVEAGTRLGLSYAIAMLPAIILVPPVVYLLCKFWVFRRKK